MKKKWQNIGLIIAGILLGEILVRRMQCRALDEIRENGRKNFYNFKLMNSLYKAAQDNVDFDAYFRKNGYKKIAVYGASYIGERFIKELEGSDTQVQYVIDKRAENLQSGIRSYHPEEKLPEVDAIIVTSTFFYCEIKRELEKKMKCDIIPLEEVIDG